MKYFIASFILIFFTPYSLAEENRNIVIGNFSDGQLSQWKDKSFADFTNYQLVTLDHAQVLKATSQSAASGLFKEQIIDLKQTPFLNWRWRIDNRLANLNEMSKSGDDYSARVYVVVSGGWAFWKTRAINYVWSSNLAKNTVWENAFAGKNAMMIAVRSTTDNQNSDKTNTWYQEKRNIMEDLKQQFGADIRYIDAVAIMTDTDNAKGNATAYYGDIYFSAD